MPTTTKLQKIMQPCKHMEGLLNKAHDGNLSKPLLWYVKIHLKFCKECRAFSAAISNVISKLKQSRNSQVDEEVILRLTNVVQQAGKSAPSPKTDSNS